MWTLTAGSFWTVEEVVKNTQRLPLEQMIAALEACYPNRSEPLAGETGFSNMKAVAADERDPHVTGAYPEPRVICRLALDLLIRKRYPLYTGTADTSLYSSWLYRKLLRLHASF